MSEPLTIASLRAELGLTLADFGERIGLSKSQTHDAEATNRTSLRVAVEIEALSEGRIDAADLNDDVRKARHGIAITPSSAPPATGQNGELSGERERVA